MAWEKARVPVTGVLGAGFGACTGELVSETFARGTGLTGWGKVGAKGFMKGLIMLLFYGISTRAPGLWSLLFEIAGYSSLGTVFFDVFYQLYPGGIWGMAEAIAVGLRGAVVGAERVAAELEVVEAGKVATEKAVAGVY